MEKSRFNPKCHTGVAVKDRSTKAARDLDWEAEQPCSEEDEAISIRFALEQGRDVAQEFYGVDHAI